MSDWGYITGNVRLYNLGTFFSQNKNELRSYHDPKSSIEEYIGSTIPYDDLSAISSCPFGTSERFTYEVIAEVDESKVIGVNIVFTGSLRHYNSDSIADTFKWIEDTFVDETLRNLLNSGIEGGVFSIKTDDTGSTILIAYDESFSEWKKIVI